MGAGGTAGSATPPLEPAPGEEAARHAAAAERVALVYGAAAALPVLAELGRPLEGLGRLHARLRRFEELVEAHQQRRAARPTSPEEVDLVHGLRQLDAPGAGTLRVLVELFLSWVGGAGSGRLIARRSLRRVAEEAQPGGLGTATRALGRAWQAAFRKGEEFGRRRADGAGGPAGAGPAVPRHAPGPARRGRPAARPACCANARRTGPGQGTRGLAGPHPPPKYSPGWKGSAGDGAWIHSFDLGYPAR